MAVNKIQKFRTIEEVMTFLNGGVVGGVVNKSPGPPSNNAPGVGGLVGATLTFTSPSQVTVTFAVSSGSNPDPYTLLLSDIKAQIQAADPALLVTQNQDGRIVITEVTPTDGVAIAASSGGGYATVVGTVDLRTLHYGAGGSLDGKTLKVTHNGGATLTTTFAAPANQGAVVSQINANTVAGGITASINGSNQLVLQSSDVGAGASITVAVSTAPVILGISQGTTTGASANTANSLLGFDTANPTVGKVYSPAVVSSTPPCWTWTYSGNDNMHACYTWE
jgi:hypothetical protein